MAVILDDFPHMAGTASSLAGTLRFSIGALVGAILSMAPGKSAWPMVSSMALCSIVAVLFYLYASRPRNNLA
ncbi:Bicyclomycin resistance protein [compost metagenome]